MADYIKKCPECGGINLFWNKEKGEVICRDCGLVIEEKMIDFGQEWREFDSEEGDKLRRAGAPMTYTQYDQGLGTEVGRKADLSKLGTKSRNKFFPFACTSIIGHLGVFVHRKTYPVARKIADQTKTLAQNIF